MGDDDKRLTIRDDNEEAKIRDELEKLTKGKRKKAERFVLAAMSSIPWVGGFLSASANLDAEADQGQINHLLHQWVNEHRLKLEELARTLADVSERIRLLGAEAEKRAESDAYLGLVRKGFSVWDRADTSEKRDYVRRLLSNAAGTQIADDDLIRLFIEWIERYHEVHFAVIRAIYKFHGSTRADIWQEVYGRPVRESSAEADLFKLLIRDLSTGSVIRQHRETNASGQFLRKPRVPVHRASPVMKSAFDDNEAYELTELGTKFVHYVLNDVVPRLGAEDARPSRDERDESVFV
jgi:hypothetical protein